MPRNTIAPAPSGMRDARGCTSRSTADDRCRLGPCRTHDRGSALLGCSRPACGRPARSVRRRPRGIRLAPSRRVGDAAQALRHELPRRRLPCDACARGRACAAQVGHLVPRESGPWAPDGDGARAPLERGHGSARSGPGRGCGDRAPHCGGRRDRRRDPRPSGGEDDRGGRLRGQRRRDRPAARSAGGRSGRLGRRRGARHGRGRAPRRPGGVEPRRGARRRRGRGRRAWRPAGRRAPRWPPTPTSSSR